MSTGSMDVVLTVHAVEPNRGRGKQILSELLRVAKRYLVMIEPRFELGSDVTKSRIERHRYVEPTSSGMSDGEWTSTRRTKRR
jgi:hypothetical protein